MKEKPSFYGIIPANVRYAQIADRAKLIFSEITALANQKGYCNASNGYFADVWNCDPSTISRHISTLENSGFVKCEYIRDGKEVKERRIFPISMGGVLHGTQGGIAPDTIGVLHGTQGGIAPSVKENSTSINTTSKNNKKSGVENADTSKIESVKEVIDYLNTKANTSFKATTKETIQFVTARQKVDGWDLEDFKLIIDFKVHDWGKDDRMKQYICPSTLFRASNAEKYMQAAKAWKESSKVGQNGQIRYSKEDKISPMKYDRVLPTPKLNKV